MPKTILITGATDGLGLATARSLVDQGHDMLIHGRNPQKLEATSQDLKARGAAVTSFCADLSDLAEVQGLADSVRSRHDSLDVLINNAGVFKTPTPRTPQGMDIRFVVNTFAPALLTRLLMPVLNPTGRVIYLSSAAQASVDINALSGQRSLEPLEAYAQSKLALTMWSQAFAAENPDGPVSIAVNPGSFLATNMVQQGFGVAGNSIEIGADILSRAALSPEFANASGQYFDNDKGRFSDPHQDALRPAHVREVVEGIAGQIEGFLTGAA